MSDDDELGLAPWGDEDGDLGLAPVEDEDAKKVIAPDVPLKSGTRLIPVICSACRTRMYAGEDQVGLWKKCPDCERLTEIRYVPPKFMLIADDPEAAGGYEVKEPEIDRSEIYRQRAEERLAEAEKRQRDYEARKNDARKPPPTFDDQGPPLERVFNTLLKSPEEIKEEQKIKKREAKIEAELEAVKKATREGTLEQYLASKKGNRNADDPAARKRAEKQRDFEAAQSEGDFGGFTPPSHSNAAALFAALDDAIDDVVQAKKPSSLLEPLFDLRCRARMLILIVCGFFGNFFLLNANSMIWEVIFDRTNQPSADYGFRLTGKGFSVPIGSLPPMLWDSSVLIVCFWIGAVLSVIWVALLFLFAINLFLETREGKDRVENWIPFDLDFGFSYIGWCCLILFVSGFPGFLLWQGLSYFQPEWEGVLMLVLLIGHFFCFPILFLCVIESDTFLGQPPRKTLASLVRQPGFWLKFYTVSFPFAILPPGVGIGLALVGTIFEEYWIMHTVLYYLVAAAILTAVGFCVLLYFRLLGQTAWRIGI